MRSSYLITIYNLYFYKQCGFDATDLQGCLSPFHTHCAWTVESGQHIWKSTVSSKESACKQLKATSHS